MERRGEAQDGSSSTREERERGGCHGGATVQARDLLALLVRPSFIGLLSLNSHVFDRRFHERIWIQFLGSSEAVNQLLA